MKQAVFIDRDGVVNKSIIRNGKPFSPRNMNQLEILAGVRESVELLKKKGFEVVVVTNQPDVVRGLISLTLVSEMHQFIKHSTGINHFYLCCHDNKDNCYCRKPKPGMLLEAASDLDLVLTKSFLVGDRWKDILAGQQVGCHCFFIDYHYSEPKPVPPFRSVKSLLEAANFIAGTYET